MARAKIIKNSLNGGEWDRGMSGRMDIEKYGDSVQTMKNFIPLAQGGAIHRPGTRFINDGYEGEQVHSYMKPFVFSTEQAYMLEFTRNRFFNPMGRCRFYRNKARIPLTAQTFTDTDITIGPNAPSEIEVSTKHYLMRKHGSGNVGGAFDITGGTPPTASDSLSSVKIRLPTDETFESTDINVGTDEITVSTHNWESGQGPFRLRTTGSFSDDGSDGELDTNTDYHVHVQSSTVVKLYDLSVAGAVSDVVNDTGTGLVNLTAQFGSGTHTLYPTLDYKRTKFQIENSSGTLITFTAAGTGPFSIDASSTQPASTEVVAEADLPYLEAELESVNYAQSADVLYLAHPNHPPAKMQRFGHGEWQYDEISLLDGPYLDEHIGESDEDSVMTISGTFSGNPPYENIAGGRKKVEITTGAGFFKASDIGRHMRLRTGTIAGSDLNDWTWCIIREVVSSTIVLCDFYSEVPVTGACETWRLGAWGSGTDTGYPGHITFAEQRLAWGNYLAQPNAFHTSNTADFENMAPSDMDSVVQANQSLNLILGANSVDAIRWLKPVRSLIIGTTDSVWPLQATSFLDPITPTNIQAKPSSSIGSADVVPVVVDDVIIYLTRTSRQVLGLSYVFDRDAYVSEQFDIEAAHITKSGVRAISRQLEPYKNIWFLRNDGRIAGLTYMREHRIRAWHRHIFGGTFDGDSEHSAGIACVESIATIPAQDGESETGNHDQLWMVVKRTVNGGTRRFIEVMEEPFWDDDVAVSDAWFVDAGLKLTAAGGDIVGSVASGLDHLEGETVVGLYDGSYLGPRLVTGGSISIPAAGVSQVIVGLYEGADLKLWPPTLESPASTAEAGEKLIDTVWVRLKDAIGGSIGSDESHLSEMATRGIDAFDTAPSLYQGDYKDESDSDWDASPEVFIRQNHPYPMTVVAVITALRISERGK